MDTFSSDAGCRPEEVSAGSNPAHRVFTLSEVCHSIQKTLSLRYGSSFWVKAEMHKLNFYPGSGHCFPDLLQKEKEKVVAEMRSVIWKSDYERITQSFLSIVKEPLKEGVEILFEARIQYDPRYGLSLRILNIDPMYALGSLERERRACVEALKKEGLWLNNTRLHFPLLPSRIALLSVSSSKGYSDFMQVLGRSCRPYRFHVELFPVLLQGEGASSSITGALNEVRTRIEEFDIVAIVRGGGGDVGLNVYNHYDLAKTICEFPIPVLSGIGHSTNLTVVEENSWFHAITPTELAYYIANCFVSFEQSLQLFHRNLADAALQKVWKEREKLRGFSLSMRSSRIHLSYRRAELEQVRIRIGKQALNLLRSAQDSLGQKEQTLKWADPERMLRKGYTLTYGEDGKILLPVGPKLDPGKKMQTRFACGRRIESVVVEDNRDEGKKDG